MTPHSLEAAGCSTLPVPEKKMSTSIQIVNMNRRAFTFRYLSSWFVLDVLGALPWDVMIGDVNGNAAKALPRLFRYLRGVKFIRCVYGFCCF